jgi:hypothetical protein
MLAAVLAAPPLAADWLLLHDGNLVETRGEWTVEGAQVRFYLSDGTFASLPLRQVDLEGSRRATEEARLPPPEVEPEARREPVFVLTDGDVGRVPADELPSLEGALGDAVAPSPETRGASGVEVASWTSGQNATTGALDVLGTLRNFQDTLAFDVQLLVRAFGPDGQLLDEGIAGLSRPGIPPQGAVSFQVSFPGLVLVERFEFVISAQRADLGQRVEQNPPGPVSEPPR